MNEWSVTNLGSESESLAWNVPVTRGIDISNNSVINVFSNGVELQELGIENKTLISGWRQEGNNLWITLKSNQNATLIMENNSEIKLGKVETSFKLLGKVSPTPS